ncbi:MAG TPA: RHS repeat-associated core domain-containing protein, partial [Terriglobales bacterium]|nr:RHS repeat-associated core domain-containing protein [Terriglobales bacterium]
TTLAGAAVYSALGLTSVTFGSGDSDTYQYDAATGRMNQYQFQVNGATDTGALTWNANGSLGRLAITDSIAGSSDTQTCNYTHDDLGRIAAAAFTGGDNWSQTFNYDSLGNVLKSGTQSFQPNYGINNRISTNIGFAPNYDSDGNLLGDPASAQQNVNGFDAEGHAVTLEGIGVTYDALGRAVEAAEPNGAIEFLYGPGGGKLAVMSGQTLGTAYIPLPGGGTAVYHGAALAYYRHADGLGSSRLASTPSRTLYSATAYAPYGEPHQESGTIDRNFTGQNQDITGGQYDFFMRELNPIQARWWTPDPAGLAAVDPYNPQSWNRYAYVGGQPLSFVESFGLDRVCIDDGLGTMQCVDTDPGGIGTGGDGGGGGGGTGLCTDIASRAGGFLAAAASPAPCGGTVATGVGGRAGIRRPAAPAAAAAAAHVEHAARAGVREPGEH